MQSKAIKSLVKVLNCHGALRKDQVGKGKRLQVNTLPQVFKADAIADYYD